MLVVFLLFRKVEVLYDCPYPWNILPPEGIELIRFFGLHLIRARLTTDGRFLHYSLISLKGYPPRGRRNSVMVSFFMTPLLRVGVFRGQLGHRDIYNMFRPQNPTTRTETYSERKQQKLLCTSLDSESLGNLHKKYKPVGLPLEWLVGKQKNWTSD